METQNRRWVTYGLHNFRQIPQLERFTRDELFAMEVVGRVLPFRTNSYVINELIDWEEAPDDPIFRMTFPQAGMLKPNHFAEMASALKTRRSPETIAQVADQIRRELNPHPSKQTTLNVPLLDGKRLKGLQHKYGTTVLFFPSEGQVCHAHCTFCFRWPQFVDVDDLRFAMRETDLLVAYLQRHPEVTDVLITGGDPMLMRASRLAAYINSLINADIPHLQTIRIGTKTLGFWPYRYLTDPDADAILRLFTTVAQKGLHLALMAHITHPTELQTRAVREAVARIRSTGAQIRTQAPLLAHINDDPDIWRTMWQQQTKLGMNPYYMFVVRDTGAQHHFAVPLIRAWQIYRDAQAQLSGIVQSARGPVMSVHEGKVEIVCPTSLGGQAVLALRYLQARVPSLIKRLFYAKYDSQAVWFDELSPADPDQQPFFRQADSTAVI